MQKNLAVSLVPDAADHRLKDYRDFADIKSYKSQASN